MFQPFITALLERILEFAAKHPETFTKKDRKADLEKLKLPAPFIAYLAEVSEKALMKDIETATVFAKSGYKNVNLSGNKLFKAVAQFLREEFAGKLDFLDSEVSLMSDKSKREVVEKLINSSNNLADSLKNILLKKTYQQIASEIFKLSQKVEKTPYVLVQSPKEIETNMKKEIRAKLSEKEESAFPIFQINRKLVGGLRVFKDGKSVDHSWLSKVQYFTSLTN